VNDVRADGKLQKLSVVAHASEGHRTAGRIAAAAASERRQRDIAFFSDGVRVVVEAALRDTGFPVFSRITSGAFAA
jgi:hypothetical protein